jgi:hypothetical protein
MRGRFINQKEGPGTRKRLQKKGAHQGGGGGDIKSRGKGVIKTKERGGGGEAEMTLEEGRSYEADEGSITKNEEKKTVRREKTEIPCRERGPRNVPNTSCNLTDTILP